MAEKPLIVRMHVLLVSRPTRSPRAMLREPSGRVTSSTSSHDVSLFLQNEADRPPDMRWDVHDVGRPGEYREFALRLRRAGWAVNLFSSRPATQQNAMKPSEALHLHRDAIRRVVERNDACKPVSLVAWCTAMTPKEAIWICW